MNTGTHPRDCFLEFHSIFVLQQSISLRRIGLFTAVGLFDLLMAHSDKINNSKKNKMDIWTSFYLWFNVSFRTEQFVAMRFWPLKNRRWKHSSIVRMSSGLPANHFLQNNYVLDSFVIIAICLTQFWNRIHSFTLVSSCYDETGLNSINRHSNFD